MYQPSQEILDKYADVLVNFGLNRGKGVKKGEIVYLLVPECAKPMLLSLRRAVLKVGGHAVIKYIPDEVSREFYEIASDEQLRFFPGKLLKGVIDEVDHSISIIAEADKHELEGIEPKKIMESHKAMKPYLNWRKEKENMGKFTWTLALFGTEEMAKEAGISLKEYWDEIIKACYLDEDDPVKKWKEIQQEVFRVRGKLNSLGIEKVRIEADGTDLVIGLGKDRQWLGGDGMNIPSFEVYISPHCDRTQGKVRFTEPLYRYGNLIEGVELEFDKGRVVSSKAKKGEEVLKEMIATEGADKIGEFSLTDSRLSRITKFMGETLFDENVGGKFGNTHMALGNAYQDSYPGDLTRIKKKQWKEMGYNESVVHTDIVATSNRKVTATLGNGKEMVIYEGGKFLV